MGANDPLRRGNLRGCQVTHKVVARVDIGPGRPADMAEIQSGDGWNALILALSRMLTSARSRHAHRATASYGGVTVHLRDVGFDATTVETVPGMVSFQVHVEARVEPRMGEG
jgi:hypothetical protein